MNFYNPEVTFKGAVKCDNAPVADVDLTRKQDISGLSFISAIAAGSSSMLQVAGGELSINSLAITDVHVDNTQTSLANFIANESATAASLKEGDVLILTAPSDGTETYMVSGANGSSAANYTQIESPLTAAEVGGVLVAGDGISVNAGTAQISANLAAGTGLSSSVSGGQITFAFNGNSDIVAEGSSNLYFSQARSRGSIQAASDAGNLLTYANASGDMTVSTSSVRGVFSAGTAMDVSGGVIAFVGSTSNVSEGTNLYYTDSRSRLALSAGNGISYNSGTGAIAVSLVGGTAIDVTNNTISFDGSTSDVSEGTNLYHTDARSRGSIQAAGAAGNLLTYSNASGDMTVSTASVRGVFSAGTALSLVDGQYSFSGSTSDVSEGTNLYYTDSRSRLAISADAAAGNLLTYVNGTGKMAVSTSSVHGAFSAGTAMDIANGVIAFVGNTSNVSEGSNLYYTDTRVRSAISAGSEADELVSYDSANGSFSLRLIDLRKEFSITLSANTPATITHELGKRLVHVSAMDASGNQIQLNTVYTSTSALTVESVTGITVTVAVSV